MRLIWILLIGLIVPSHILAADARPNIVIVLVDDAGLGDFGCEGHPFLKTPNIDKLHSQSIRLTDFHVAPMCTPTRGQLLTGLDAVRNGATSVTGGRSFIRPGLRTLPEMLAGGGYRTGIFGKWHLGDNYPHRPMDKGFQTAFWLKGWGFTSAPMFANSLFDGTCWRGDKEDRFKGYITDVCFDEALSWMRIQNESKQPFFCYIPLNAAHSPHQVPEKYKTPFADKPRNIPGFFGMLANIDENMGRLEEFLGKSGLRENTIVIFMTDNGGTAGVRFYNAGLRGHKTEYYEGGHRVPCYIRWPAGNLGAARSIDYPTQIQDLAPTLLGFAGVKPPEDFKPDGINLATILSGTTRPTSRTFVIQYSRAKLEKWECCVVEDQWRLVNGTELYDVRVDRAQTNDLAKKNPEVIARLRAHYEKWWETLGPKVNDFVPTTIGSDAQPVVQLTSADWQDVYCDNAGHIRNAIGGPRGGAWNLNVEKAGVYEITIRRWPAELKLPLSAPEPNGGKALPVSKAMLTVAGQFYTGTKGNAFVEGLPFKVNLPAGKTQLQAWFQDEQGKDICGAFFADVTPVTGN